MAPIVKLHRATLGTAPDIKEYFFLQKPGIYTGDIATATGITVAAESEQDQPAISVAALLGKGLLFRIVASYTAAGKRKTIRLVCVKTKLGTIFDDLDGKAYNGGTLSAVRIPRDATFY